MSIETVSVYCGSSYPTGAKAPVYIKAIRDLGHALGGKSIHVRYGGGLYGHLQDLMEEVGNQGGKMQAILSSAYYDPKEVYPPHVEIVRVDSDLERAEKFLESEMRSDVVVKTLNIQENDWLHTFLPEKE